jgi:hypothetical protein
MNGHSYLQEKGEFPKPTSEHPIQQILVEEEVVLRMVDDSPTTSVRRIFH